MSVVVSPAIAVVVNAESCAELSELICVTVRAVMAVVPRLANSDEVRPRNWADESALISVKVKADTWAVVITAICAVPSPERPVALSAVTPVEVSAEIDAVDTEDTWAEESTLTSL